MNPNERDGCITFYILAIVVFTTFAAITHLSDFGNDDIDNGTVVFTLVFDGLAIGTALALWHWKTWALVILVCLHLINFLSYFVLPLPIITSIIALVNLGILYYLYHDKMSLFEW